MEICYRTLADIGVGTQMMKLAYVVVSAVELETSDHRIIVPSDCNRCRQISPTTVETQWHNMTQTKLVMKAEIRNLALLVFLISHNIT